MSKNALMTEVWNRQGAAQRILHIFARYLMTSKIDAEKIHIIFIISVIAHTALIVFNQENVPYCYHG